MAEQQPGALKTDSKSQEKPEAPKADSSDAKFSEIPEETKDLSIAEIQGKSENVKDQKPDSSGTKIQEKPEALKADSSSIISLKKVGGLKENSSGSKLQETSEEAKEDTYLSNTEIPEKSENMKDEKLDSSGTKIQEEPEALKTNSSGLKTQEKVEALKTDAPDSNIHEKSVDAKKKRSSLVRMPKIKCNLCTLREAQFVWKKKLKIMKDAQPKYTFTDLEIKTELAQRRPDKEMLMYLHSENRRCKEKQFFAEIEDKKCELFLNFYSDYKMKVFGIFDQLTTMKTAVEAEELLRILRDELAKSLYDAQNTLLKHKKALAVHSTSVKKLEMKVGPASPVARDVEELKTKLENGTDLKDNEILRLSLGKCLEMNSTLKKAVETHGNHIDSLREQYLWKRDIFVSKLATDFDPTVSRADLSVGPSLTSPDRRSPSCNKGKNMRDFEEELSVLRKENFDLKMRVYVLNEQMELFQNIDNADQLYDVNTNLKKEVDKLKTELADKEELVLQAGDAMKLLRDKHQDEVNALQMELQEQCSNLQEMNLRLEQEVQKLMSQHNMTAPNRTLDQHPDADSSELYTMAFAPLPSATLNFSKQLEVENIRLEQELAEKLKIIDENDRLIKEHDEMIKKAKLRQQELETELSSKSELLSGVYEKLREKEHMHLQMCKKACALEDLVNLKQLEVEKLQKAFVSKPTPEDMRDLRNRYECCTTENNVLINRITELENKLEEEESKKIALEAIQEKAKCSSCRQNRNLEETLDQVREQLIKKERELESSKKELYTTVKAFQGCLKANKALTVDIVELNKKLESCGDPQAPKKEDSAQKIRELADRVDQLQREKELLAVSMEDSLDILREQLREKEKLIQTYELKSTECNNSKVEELEAQVLKLKSDMEGYSSLEATSDVEKKQLLADVESKKKEIEQLNEELRKRTFNLQELVNKELWDKNREIEKLNKACERKQGEVVSLKERLTSQEYELRALNDKMQELSDQVTTSESISDLKSKLAEEIEKRTRSEGEAEMWKKTADESEKVRKELMNACGLFKARLEELASFLESLLPCLGSKKRKILQDAIDRSREASRTLSQSVMNENSANETALTIPILPDISQVDFCSDNDIDVTVDDANKSCLVAQNVEVANLRAKMESVVQKLDEVRGASSKPKLSWKINNYEDRFDFVKLANMSSSFNIEEVSEVSLPESFSDTASAPSRQPSQPKPMIEPPVEKCFSNKASALSESEGWSEPDRNVSLARIGLRDSSVPVARLSTEESSDNSCKVAFCKRRCESAEIRRLSLKVRSLERVIHNMKTDHTSSARSPSRDVSPTGGGDAPDKFISAVDDLKKEKDKLEASLKSNKEILNRLTASYEDEPSNKELLKAVHMIAHQFEQIYGFFTEMEDHYLAIEEEKEAVHQSLIDKEKKIDALNKELTSLQAELKEKENEVLEKQCALLEMKNDYILMENKCKIMETTIEELGKWKKSMEKSEEELEAMKDTHMKDINNLKNKLKRTKEERDAEVNELKSSLDRAFKRIDDVCLKKVLMETEFKQKVDSLQKEKRLEVEQEVIKRIDIERKLVEAYETQAELRKRLEEEMTKSKDVEAAQKSSERWWRRRTEEVESSCADREAELRRRLDNATISTSQAVLERTRLANEKIRLQCELRRRENSAHDMRAELEQRVVELEEMNKELLRKLKALRGSQHLSDIESPPPFSRQRSNPTSDYTSDPDQHELKGSNSNLNNWFPVCGRSNNNCSPDLGIESDQGRLSSLDPPIGSPKTYGDLEREIAYLKRELARKSRLLEDAHRISKIEKGKLEDKIYSELGKTHDLLEKTKRNFKKAQI